MYLSHRTLVAHLKGNRVPITHGTTGTDRPCSGRQEPIAYLAGDRYLTFFFFCEDEDNFPRNKIQMIIKKYIIIIIENPI